VSALFHSKHNLFAVEFERHSGDLDVSHAVLLCCGEGISRVSSLATPYMHVVGKSNIDSATPELNWLRALIDPSKHFA